MSMSSCNESPGLVHLDMITHMLNQGGGAHKAIDRSVLYEEGCLSNMLSPLLTSFSLSLWWSMDPTESPSSPILSPA